jgi:hypothetical protein
MVSAPEVRVAWYGRALLAAGFALTAATGIGLWLSSDRFGVDFAWEIKAPLTAAFMGSWYVGAALALLSALRQTVWSHVRIVLVIALTLTTMSMVATVRFFDDFRVGEGTTGQQAIAGIWLVVYGLLPPFVVVTFVLHERAGGRDEYGGTWPHTRLTRAVFAFTAVSCSALGLWLTVAPSSLIQRWPWTLNDLSASIVGAWALTLGVGCAWALREGDWSRSGILLRPLQVALALLLAAVVRYDETLTDSDAAVAVYVAALVALFAAFTATGIVQSRRRPS